MALATRSLHAPSLSWLSGDALRRVGQRDERQQRRRPRPQVDAEIEERRGRERHLAEERAAPGEPCALVRNGVPRTSAPSTGRARRAQTHARDAREVDPEPGSVRAKPLRHVLHDERDRRDEAGDEAAAGLRCVRAGRGTPTPAARSGRSQRAAIENTQRERAADPRPPVGDPSPGAARARPHQRRHRRAPRSRAR